LQKGTDYTVECLTSEEEIYSKLESVEDSIAIGGFHIDPDKQ